MPRTKGNLVTVDELIDEIQTQQSEKYEELRIGPAYLRPAAWAEIRALVRLSHSIRVLAASVITRETVEMESLLKAHSDVFQPPFSMEDPGLA